MAGIENIEQLYSVNLEDSAKKYLMDAGMSEYDIALLKEKLS